MDPTDIALAMIPSQPGVKQSSWTPATIPTKGVKIVASEFVAF